MKKITFGWVYFIKSQGYYKVGITQNCVRSRLIAYKTHNPIPITLEEIIHVNNFYECEAYLLNNYFKKETKKSDWCKLSRKEVEEIKSYMVEYEKKHFLKPDYKKQLLNTIY